MACRSKHGFVEQLSPWGCFATAIVNAYIYMGKKPPDSKKLVERTRCEETRGNVDKAGVLRRLRGVKFQPADLSEVLRSAGIITFRSRRYKSHSAFFYRVGKRTYAVNAYYDDSELIEHIKIKQFMKDTSEWDHEFIHWRVV